MTFNEYQELAMRTNNKKDLLTELTTAALGICGEGGEVADLIKKHIEQGHQLDREKLLLEISDVMWYIAKICTALDITMEQVAIMNIDKLKKRYPNGFTTEDSIYRVV